MPKPPSRAVNPDLDWSQVRETVLMLNLAVSQIGRAMQEGDDSVTNLTDTFTEMMGHAREIQSESEKLASSTGSESILEHSASISSKMQSTLITLQFYDKLTQRLTHISNTLAELGSLVSHPAHLYNPSEWHGLQEKILESYPIEADRKMFEALLEGATVEEALHLAQSYDRIEQENDIELF